MQASRRLFSSYAEGLKSIDIGDGYHIMSFIKLRERGSKHEPFRHCVTSLLISDEKRHGQLVLLLLDSDTVESHPTSCNIFQQDAWVRIPHCSIERDKRGREMPFVIIHEL